MKVPWAGWEQGRVWPIGSCAARGKCALASRREPHDRPFQGPRPAASQRRGRARDPASAVAKSGDAPAQDSSLREPPLALHRIRERRALARRDQLSEDAGHDRVPPHSRRALGAAPGAPARAVARRPHLAGIATGAKRDASALCRREAAEVERARRYARSLNAGLGRNTGYFGGAHAAASAAGMRIAFRRGPDIETDGDERSRPKKEGKRAAEIVRDDE